MEKWFDWRDPARRSLTVATAALLIIVLALIVVAIMAVMNSEDLAVAVFAIVGVVISSAFSALVTLAQVTEASRVQVASVTWAKKLEVHQTAFVHWDRVIHTIYDDREKLLQILQEARKFWVESNIYMSTAAREQFKLMISAASTHAQLVDAYRGRKGEGVNVIESNWNTVAEVGRILVEDAGGSISDKLLKDLKPSPDHL